MCRPDAGRPEAAPALASAHPRSPQKSHAKASFDVAFGRHHQRREDEGLSPSRLTTRAAFRVCGDHGCVPTTTLATPTLGTFTFNSNTHSTKRPSARRLVCHFPSVGPPRFHRECCDKGVRRDGNSVCCCVLFCFYFFLRGCITLERGQCCVFTTKHTAPL